MVATVPRPICIYHKNCLDGKAAAAVVLRRWPEAELKAMQYGETPPTVEGRDVAVVDFSLSLEAMRALRAQAASLTWIDHHVSSVDLIRRLGWGAVDTNTCGAVLTWRTLFPNQTPPPILAYVEDKDLWRWLLPDSRAVAAGLTATFGGDKVAGILEADPAAMAEVGRPLLAKQAERVAKAVAGGTPLDNAFGQPGLRALVVPARADLNEIGEQACALGYDVAVMLYRKADGTWVHSLRSSSFDCATLAARLGGGGHPSSACYLSRTPLIPPHT